ncbi:ATPase [Rhodophyticola sp. CCM32]|uniref:ATPase n=1 Tax=Rhodophyticola sp. CCM32 TaxID=2916397 RepID=UPI00107F09E4|nr:ATPase [Rhodophyticola sp. CCM32]QBY02649.1 ATPase [Rhodophyticola sp. CCM32]
MIYDTPEAWQNAAEKHLLVFGMSGLGKTRLASMLRGDGGWFHYSVDYRIGTAYMGEHIADNLKRVAMQTPFLAGLLRSDSIYIGSNITFDNLDPLSSFLGKPGDPSKGGLGFDDYQYRQALHRRAEINALLDTPGFIARARDLYGYPNFICDTGGSICEVVEPENPKDEVLTTLARNTLMVWIEGSEDHTAELIRRFDQAPKPMYYQPEFLIMQWTSYLKENNVLPDNVDPDDFVRFAYASALAHRAPLYRAMARNWGVTVTADEVASIRDGQDATDLIGIALGRRAESA